MRLRYDIVDVFTDRPFAGNQLAVVHGAEDLTSAQCLALAREIPFAGHPTLGTAWVLRSLGLLGDGPVTQVCGAGRIGVCFEGDLVELSAAPRDLIGPLADDLVAALLADLGLSLTDLAGPVYVAGCGLSFAHVPVVPDAVARARVSTRPLAEYAPAIGSRDPFEGINLVAVSGSAPDLKVHARVFVPGLSVPEDPATGSAAAGLGLALVASGCLPEGGRYDIAQGIELGRPSRLAGRVEASGGVPTRCHVAGEVQHIASGEVVVPPLS